MTCQPAICFPISFHHPFNRAGWRTSNVAHEHRYPENRSRFVRYTIFYPTLLVLSSLGVSVPRALGESPGCRYDAPTRMLTVALAGADRFQYVFNKGGAINGIFDLAIAPGENLIGPSFQGESTDRVIQWTYWNGRYKVPSNSVGDKDRRANATMEGSFAGVATCDVVATPTSGPARKLRFVSQLRHWFYANLDTHGTPDFLTTSDYEVLDDGSLKLTRLVTRHPWKLTNIHENRWNGTEWVTTLQAETTMVCEHYGSASQTSYFEGWSPFRRSVLPLQKHGLGTFSGDGYRFWKPQALGGWAMAYGRAQAVALVFGKTEHGDPACKLQVSFNKLDLPEANLNILMPAVETSWPDHKTLTQILILVPGDPADVERRAISWADSVPVPTISDAKVSQ
jgi:hypothetical protein